MKIYSLILAKGQSKRLPHKNIRMFHGKPMFLWNVEKCLGIFDECYVSSDSDKILKMAKKAGAIPIKRNKALCGNVPNIPIYQQSLKAMKDADVIVAIQACSPTIDEWLLETTKNLMLSGCKELMTCHPMEENEVVVNKELRKQNNKQKEQICTTETAEKQRTVTRWFSWKP